jgi:hypothetical protein
MAIIKKFAETLTQPLTSFGTFLVDTNPNSTYFKITEFKDSFTGGKNGFLIEGSEHLMESTEIKIQILDVNGNPIYYEPGNGVPEYYEGTSKVIAVYVYEDTPIGTARITILGELKTYLDEGGVVQSIPEDWKNVYNVKWEKEFKVNRLLSNEDKVRFYRRPQVTINEIVKPIFNNVTTTVIQTGSLSGQAQAPRVGEPLSDYTAPTTYLLEIEDSTNWTGSIVGNTINVPALGYSAVVDSVINNKQLLVTTPYTEVSLLGSAYSQIVANFLDEGYTASFNYIEGVNNLKTALTGSFAKIVLSDLTTFVGDVSRVKIFRKSQSDLADYQFIQEIRLESNEILRDLESQVKNEEFYGIFDTNNFKNYWITSSNNITSTFNQNYLYNSVRLNSNNSNFFHTTASLGVTQNIEYTLTFNTRIGTGSVNPNNYIRAFLSGSKSSSVNGSPKIVQVEKNIVTVTSDSSLLQKNQITANFKADESNNTKLYFEVKGNDWYISDVSLRASQETAYSPDEITFIQSVPRTLPEETFDYRFEFYDINNNYIPVLVEESKTFNGGNIQRIQKGLVFTPRSLQFQFDSGSQPVPPTVVGFTVTKNLLTGSVTYTSQSFDFDGNELSGSDYTASFTGRRYPGLLSDITSDAPTMTVGNFTGSRTDKTVQLIKITGEVEGFTDTVIFSRVLDGFGGVNYLIRPYRGTQIRNSSTASLELQAVRIDGVNDIELSSTTKPEKGWPDKQLHIISRSADGAEKFVNLAYASSSRYIYGLTTGSLGSGEINYNATFNRDSIDFRRTIYLISSQSAASGPAFLTSGSVVASVVLEDLQDGLDSGVVIFNADSFTINPRTESEFKPAFAFATASFAKRGTAASEIEAVTASFQIYPSMSINRDWVPEYWMYYHTQSLHPTITVVAKDDNKNTIPSQIIAGNVRSPLNQTKNLTLTFTYTEPWTSASVSLDKTFTIVPEGKQGDESIVFEVNPVAITLGANSRGVVNDFIPSITDIKLKQGSRYLAFSASAGVPNNLSTHGTFHIATASIIENRVKAGNVHFTSSFGTPYTASLIVSASSNMTDLSGSITYPLIIHPYYTSSIYTASVVVNYTKVLEGPPPIQILITPPNATLTADEVGFVTPVGYSPTNTTLQVKEGDDFLRFTTQSTAPGTWRINSIETRGGSIWNIRTGSLSSSSLSTATINYNRFDYPYVSASALYTIQVYPFALGSGHEYTSSIFTRTQTFTKNVSVPNARTVELKANPYTINYDRDGYKVSPEGDVELKATAINTTGSSWFTLFFVDTDGSETLYDGPYFEGVGITEKTFFIPGTDAAGPEENKTWRVKITDGNPYTSSILNPYKAEGQLTIAGIKAGADAYKVSPDNVSTSITAELFNTNISGTAIKLPTYKGTTPLINVTSGNYPAPQPTDYDYLENLIGILGYSSASIVYKSSWITLGGSPANTITTSPASKPNIASWDRPAINKSGEIVYKIDFEGYSPFVANDFVSRPPTRQTEFVTQSFAVQFTEPAPYDIKLQNEASAVIYRVSGEVELNSTSNIIRAYRGTYELTNRPTGFTGVQTDAYGSSSYEYQCTVEITSKSNHITLGGGLIVGSKVTGTPASMPGVTAWNNPEENPTAEIVYGINCEGRQTIFKTQSLSVQFEGAVGPGIVMRGEWSQAIDYIGQVETTNNRRDAVTYLATPDTVKYYASVSGSGPNTNNQNGVPVGYHAPTPNGTNAWWEYLGDQEFFVAAKIAIFEESYVKNTINVGTKDGTGAFANIVLAGGRTDPYIAIGQNATIGTSGNSGTTLNPGGSVIGYNRPGIFLGIYEDGGNGTTGRFSIKTTGTSGKGLFWDGDALTIIGAIRQIEPGVSEGSLRGAWTAGDTYFTNDIVSYQGQSWRCTSAQAQSYQHIATNNTNALTGYPGSGPWAIAAAAGTSGTAGTAGSGGVNGATGGPGPGVVYRGQWAQFESDGTTPKAYYREPAAPALATRRDVVKGSNGQYYLCKVNHTTAVGSGGVSTKPITGVDYATYWESFGATFSSIATDILLAQDATITRGLVIGTDGLTDGFIRSTGADTLTTGTAPGFYLQQDGKFRFGQNVAPGEPYIYWDNSTLEIRGKIITDANEVSEIGNWKVENGNFQDSTDSIILNANSKAIQIFNSGTKRVDIKQGNISTPGGGAGTVIIDPPASITYSYPGNGEFIGPGSFYSDDVVYDTIGFSVAAAGTYTKSVVNWGTDGGITAQADSNFDGSFYFYAQARIYTTPDATGTLIDSFTIAYMDNINTAYQYEQSYWNDGFAKSFTFPAAGTYYIHIYTSTSGYAQSGEIILQGSIDAQSQTFNAQLSQIEIGQNGLLAISDADNYAKIERYDPASAAVPIIDIKTNLAQPGLRITNANASGRAIEVLDGDIYLSGTGNNFRVAGGYIGTDNTAAGIRMGTDNTNSVLIGASFPESGAAARTARLRPAGPKFGITGRELISDSSTIRIKRDIEDYPTSAYESIRRIKPVLFTPMAAINSDVEEDYSINYPLIPNPKEYIGKQGGFIAEWLDADPELRRYCNYGVSGSISVVDAVSYERLIVPLTKTVQILMNKVEALEAYISSSKI